MIFNQSYSKIIVFCVGLYFLAACSGDADKFRQAVVAGNLKIQEFVVAPDARFISANETLQFTATAKLENGSSADLTGRTSWSTSDGAIANIDSAGLLTAKQDGVVTVSARFADRVATAQLNVLTANLVGIVMQGPTQTDECRNVQFKAIGQYDAGPTRPDIDVDWSVSRQDIATISNEAGSKGLLTTTQTGTLDISATKNGVTQTQTVTVNDSLSTIAVTPSVVSIAKNNTQQLSATATYQGNSTEDISSITTWTSDNTGVVSVDSKGLIKGVATGSASVSGACGGVQGSAAITVTTQTNGDALRINDGKDFTLKSDEKDDEDLQLTLTLIKADGSSEEVTEEADWSIEGDGLSVIEVSNAKGSKGKISIPNKDLSGTTQVKADYKEQMARIRVTIEQ